MADQDKTKLDKVGEWFGAVQIGDPSISPGRSKLKCRKSNPNYHGPVISWDRMDKDLRDTMRELVRGNLDWPLFVYGKQGTGKSVSGQLLNSVVQGSIMKLMSFYEGSVFDEWYKGSDWDQFNKAELVIIDEIGARTNSVNEYSYQALKRMLDEREQRSNRVGMYISNLGPKELAEMYDERIVSRLMAGTVHEYKGVDMRIQHHKGAR